jgi:hypothetical protein
VKSEGDGKSRRKTVPQEETIAEADKKKKEGLRSMERVYWLFFCSRLLGVEGGTP